MNDPRAILVTGVYGTGKSSVIGDIGDLLENGPSVYAAIDLDWLVWSNAPGAGHDAPDLLARNLGAVVSNYRAAGVERILLAGFVPHRSTVAAIRDAIDMPLFVVRLTAPLAVIAARLRSAPGAARLDDLETSRAALAADAGVGLEDAVVENVGPIRDASIRVLEAAGWPVR